MAQWQIDFRTAPDLSGFTNVNCDASLVFWQGEQALRLTESAGVGQGFLAVTGIESHIGADIIVLVSRDYSGQVNDRCAGPGVRMSGTSSATTRGFVAGSRDVNRIQLVQAEGGTNRTGLLNAETGIASTTEQWQRLQFSDPSGIVTPSVTGRTMRIKAWEGLITAEPLAWDAEIVDIYPTSSEAGSAVGLLTMLQDVTRRTYVRELRIGTDGDPAPTGPIVTPSRVPFHVYGMPIAGVAVPTGLTVDTLTATSVKWVWS